MRLLACCIALCLTASSQACGQNEVQKPIQANGGSAQNQPAASSTAAIKKPISSPASTPSSTQEEKDKAEHAEYERVTANSTFALAIITGLLFVATAVLAVFTFHLWGATKELASDTTEAATKQLAVMSGQLEAMKDQAESATDTLAHLQKEFLATHRPKVILRRVIFGVWKFNADPPSLRIQIANTGDSEAVISQFAYTLIATVDDKVPDALMIEEYLEGDTPAEAQGKVLANGDSYVLVVPADTVGAVDGYANNNTRISFRLYCAGYVEYRQPESNHTWRTGFIRRGNFNTRYFERVDLPDFEYAD